MLKYSTILESFVSTVNFSVPEEVKQAFNDTFKSKNKSAIVTQLMQEAIERERRRARQAAAIDRVLERRQHAPTVTDEEARSAREQGRS